MMKKITNVLTAMLLIVSSTLGFSACKNKDNEDEISAKNIQNLIILIGDGMGKNHIHNTKIYYGLDTQPFESLYVTDLDTDSLTKGSPTDSAASATALATGVSVENRRVGQNDTKELKNIMEYASDKNMLTGIVTNDSLAGATPAAFSSHTLDRSYSAEIIDDQSKSPIDLFIGQYDENYSNNESKFTSNDFIMHDNIQDLYSTDNSQKVIANLNNIYSIYNPNISNQINMVDLVEYALDYLDNENGFVLMIECAYIDKFSHNNDITSSLAEVRTLFDIASYILDYIEDNNDTALIITSDHETGGLQKAVRLGNISNNLYTTSNHTDANVALYSKGIKVRKKEIVRNTFVYDMSYEVVAN